MNKTIEVMYKIYSIQDELIHATGMLLPIAAVIVGGGLLVWGGYKIFSAIMNRELREAKKPIIIP